MLSMIYKSLFKIRSFYAYFYPAWWKNIQNNSYGLFQSAWVKFSWNQHWNGHSMAVRSITRVWKTKLRPLQVDSALSRGHKSALFEILQSHETMLLYISSLETLVLLDSEAW